jgi:hypothetical protein
MTPMTELYDAELQAAAQAAARSRRSDKRWKLILMVMSVLLGGMMVVAFWLATSNARLASENAAFGQQQQGEKKEIAKEASKALCGEGDLQIYDLELCKKWAEAAQEPTIPPTAAPLDGGPSQADLVNAFREYCANGNCKGQDGREPTPDDIAAAFARFCSDGRCVGPAGQSGKDGANGATLPPPPEMVLAAVQQVCANDACRGPVGNDGAPATADQVAAAVAAYCSTGACVGQAGKDGTNGTNGIDGQNGTNGVDGQPPSSFTFTDRLGMTYTCTPNPPGSSTYTCASDGLRP